MSDHGRVIECARKVTQRCERQGSCECSLLRKTVLMLWAFWMDKNTSHCPTPPPFPQKKPLKSPKKPPKQNQKPTGLQRIQGMCCDGLGRKEWKTGGGQPSMNENQISSLNCKSKTEKLCREQGENISKPSHKQMRAECITRPEQKESWL